MLFTTIDIETTGLDMYNSDIIQCAYAVTNEHGAVIKSECLFFYYSGVERSWSEEAFAVHGIPLEELRTHADEFETNCKKMWIALAKSNAVGYNSDHFDIPFIQKWLHRMGYPKPQPYMSYDVMQIFRSHGIRGKLSVVPERIGLSPAIIEKITESTFGEAGRAHLAFYDIIATNLCFNYAINKKWVNMNPVTLEQVTEDRNERQLDEANGRCLYNDVKYIIEDYNGNQFEVALCPDPAKYVYYKQAVESTKPQFIETVKESGYFVTGNICLHVTQRTITLEAKPKEM